MKYMLILLVMSFWNILKLRLPYPLYSAPADHSLSFNLNITTSYSSDGKTFRAFDDTNNLLNQECHRFNATVLRGRFWL